MKFNGFGYAAASASFVGRIPTRTRRKSEMGGVNKQLELARASS
jgi:hypothetical protein